MTVKMTQPQFLNKFFEKDDITMEDLAKIFPNNYKKMYKFYQYIRSLDIGTSDIETALFNGEDIIIIASKSAINTIVSNSNEFQGKIRADKKSVTISF